MPEGKPYRRGRIGRPRAGTTRRALVASGLAASVAAAGIAAAPAGAATSGKLYACYSDKTKALYYSKASGKCGKGFTRISWNKVGPQGARGARGATGSQGVQGPQGTHGPQGVQGPQGPQGAHGTAGQVAGYTKANTSNTKLPNLSPKVVASVEPATTGAYEVNGMAVVQPGVSGGAGCYDQAVNNSGKATGTTASGFDTFSGHFETIATNGILSGGPSSPIEEVCFTYNTKTSGSAYDAQLTIGQLAKPSGKKIGLRPRNRISPPKPRPGRTASGRAMR